MIYRVDRFLGVCNFEQKSHRICNGFWPAFALISCTKCSSGIEYEQVSNATRPGVLGATVDAGASIPSSSWKAFYMCAKQANSGKRFPRFAVGATAHMLCNYVTNSHSD